MPVDGHAIDRPRALTFQDQTILPKQQGRIVYETNCGEDESRSDNHVSFCIFEYLKS